MTEPLAYRPKDAAELLGITTVTLYRWIAAGRLKTLRIGRVRLVSAKSMRDLIEKGAS